MPESQVAREREASGEEQRPFARVAPHLRLAFEKPEDPQHRHGEHHAPESRGRRTRFGEPHENRRQRDASGAEHERGEGRIHGRALAWCGRIFIMPGPRFVHLRMHSEYSVTDGIVRIDEAIRRAVEDGMPALALTDAANVFGMVKFYGAARAAGVKPIVGADCWLQNDADRDKPFRLLLLCASRAGYHRLCELLSQAWLTNQHRGRAEISRAWL